MKKRWQLWLGLVVSAAFLTYALRGLELDRVWAAMWEAHYWWLVPGVLVYFLGVVARTWRWHYLLRRIRPVSLARLFPVVVIGYMGNNIYPARAGEVIRAYVLRRREGISMGASLATIIVERIFDGVVMLLFVFIALPLTPMPDWLRLLVIASTLLFFGALAVFLVIAASPARSQALYNWAIDRLMPAALRPRVRGLADRFMTGLASLRSIEDVAMIFVTSLFIWLAETVKYWFVMHAFPFWVPFWVLMLMNGVVNLSTTLPSSPGYVGTFDAPGIEILKGFGVPGPIAASYTLVLHAALWLPITLLGFYYMGRESIAWAEFGKAADEKGKDIATLKV
jgi:uncharacterized protein (TIRG00374 family)